MEAALQQSSWSSCNSNNNNVTALLVSQQASNNNNNNNNNNNRSNNGIMFGSTTSSTPISVAKVNKPLNVGPTLRCRFSRSQAYPRYSSRKAGAVSNVEVEAPNGATAIPTSLPVRVAYELLQAGHRFLDVRTPEEFSAGHVPGAINIPYMFRVLGSGMAVNPNFLAQVCSEFGKDDELLIGCQSGKRSLMATNVLQSAGYTGIVDVAGGFVAWTQSELPTEM